VDLGFLRGLPVDSVFDLNLLHVRSIVPATCAAVAHRVPARGTLPSTSMGAALLR